MTNENFNGILLKRPKIIKSNIVAKQIESLKFQFGVPSSFYLGSATSPPIASCDPFEVGDVTNMFVGSLTLSSNADIATLTGYDGITGNLIIGSAVTSLAGLESLRYIGGNIKLNSGNSGLTTLAGLDNLTTVIGDFDFSSGGAITTLSALSRLHRIGGGFDFESQPLGSLDGALPCLDSADYVLFDTIDSTSMIGAFSNLTAARYVDIQFSNNLTTVANSFPLWIPDAANQGSTEVALFELPALASATGAFASVVQVQAVKIRNTALTIIDFLSSLTTIDQGLPGFRNSGTLTIKNNSSLVNLAGFSSLTEVGVTIDIEGNPQLVSVAGLTNINGANFNGDPGLQNVTIANNSVLPTTAQAQALIDNFIGEGYVGAYTNTGNGPG